MLLFQTLEAFILNVHETHWPTLVVSAIAITLILFVKLVPDPLVVRKYVLHSIESPHEK